VRRWLAAAGILLLAHGRAFADAGDDKAEADVDAERDKVDFAVPESPAFTFLGASPTKVAHPGTIKDLGIELANGVDASGRVQQGFALAFTPIALGARVSRRDALTHNWRYIINRLQVSIGTVKVGADAAAPAVSPTDVAVGVRASLVDHGDPWGDSGFRKTLSDEMGKCRPSMPSAGDEAKPAGNDSCVDKAIEKGLEEFEDAKWNALRVVIGGAAGMRLPDSRLSDDAFFAGWSAWLVASGGLGRYVGWAAQGRYDGRRQVDNDPFEQQLIVGARVFAGGPSIHGLGEAVEKFRAKKEVATESGTDFDWTLGAEFRVTTGTWLAIGLGNALEDDKSVQVLANLRWVLSASEHFARPSQAP
jgi:hypothetical protein